ncbi:MAG: hypothetical protein A2312_04350 [Candidatus Staskawiczbacteria bacterium RIFOXYB2_FULL_32_9]|uniref:tRNA N6-adenosine threonylcarbamoyltransferase n=1 Tax=Candidatus Staskawiczbacteria bacterium RIFOXYD1_FULL_32_13 TaxID=1802234 RepID=A0A1G2JK62_9BACT|nr:MAG: O-sialoglycoprotein endopeptidase [Parcubacteria group bacterium GW2011_GWC2_32_10]OGZ78048.1 MAG: hypothetical protein A2360_02750 [Candidatus Staskawiczbacteria bacterium RIFOXYB1_FULL_32_11]OGZ80968.1 MAG: hypothetical protein A2256_00425 [Candidatus Staskawiczbacteria bacterium RIFOXYA2_FULL_32_7]OGZ81855.1 MAG: hypothetical protein A2312_04350 [Candidatus Staskawiczbacteria bacterium RIFOXYB2_FULL_32_9]OGZ85307.1 MAG: hypothetical protein A2463_00780 [Candidatus Staskawiczbacteria 
MKILAIETSCDDTGIAILDIKEGKTPEFFVLANKIASQIKVHQKYGGVFPMMAKREHQKNIIPTFIEALKSDKSQRHFDGPATISPEANLGGEAKLKILSEILEREPELAKKIIPFLKKYSKPDIDYIAVTNGPGLEPCLWVGVNFARALSFLWNIPIIPVNHIEGHILVNFLNKNTAPSSLRGGSHADEAIQSNSTNSRLPRSSPAEQANFARNDNIRFPAIALVVSGGHTQIVLVEDISKYKILGETRDDAAGECFDKAAKILGLGYPGGPIISKLADRHPMSIKNKTDRLPMSIRLPRPMLNTKDYDFSFSGLKTAILYFQQKQLKKVQKNKYYICAMCAEIQQAIIDVLLKKTFKAVKDFNAKTIILGGGVSANSELKKQFQDATTRHSRERGNPVSLIFPEPILSTDNGLMIGVAGYYNKNKTVNWKDLKADSNLRIGE